MCSTEEKGFSLANQAERFAKHKETNNRRVLAIEEFYDGSKLQGLRVLIVGANRGLGLALAKQAKADGANVVATCRKTCPELDELGLELVVPHIDVQKEDAMCELTKALEGKALDVVIHNAGYLYDVESIGNLNFEQEIKQFDVCALGPLRVTNALIKADLLKQGSKVIVITSQAGSVEWRCVQNPTGQNYGHHSARRALLSSPPPRGSPSRRAASPARRRAVAKAASNMASRLLAAELEDKQITVLMLHPGEPPRRAHRPTPTVAALRGADARARTRRAHAHVARLPPPPPSPSSPRSGRAGFNKTEMTERYKEVWDKEGAVDVEVGAKRVLHEVTNASLASSGQFVNVEDGLLIPF